MQVVSNTLINAVKIGVICSYQGNIFFFLFLTINFLEKLNLTVNISLS